MVTTPEAVKEAQSVDESTRIIKEILASGARDDPKQWINVGPDFYNVRSELVVLHEGLLRGDCLYSPPPLRTQVLGVFLKAHQSKTGMNLRAANSVWWPGITRYIAVSYTHLRAHETR